MSLQRYEARGSEMGTDAGERPGCTLGGGAALPPAETYPPDTLRSPPGPFSLAAARAALTDLALRAGVTVTP